MKNNLKEITASYRYIKLWLPAFMNNYLLTSFMKFCWSINIDTHLFSFYYIYVDMWRDIVTYIYQSKIHINIYIRTDDHQLIPSSTVQSTYTYVSDVGWLVVNTTVKYIKSKFDQIDHARSCTDAYLISRCFNYWVYIILEVLFEFCINVFIASVSHERINCNKISFIFQLNCF